jgi:hypothetical protein
LALESMRGSPLVARRRGHLQLAGRNFAHNGDGGVALRAPRSRPMAGAGGKRKPGATRLKRGGGCNLRHGGSRRLPQLFNQCGSGAIRSVLDSRPKSSGAVRVDGHSREA